MDRTVDFAYFLRPYGARSDQTTAAWMTTSFEVLMERFEAIDMDEARHPELS